MADPCLIWFTGLPGSGKTTLASAMTESMRSRGLSVLHLDGDRFRQGVSSDLGFSEQDRFENLRRVAEVAKLALEQEVWVVASFVSPFRAGRAQVETLIEPFRHLEIHLDCSLSECQRRDPKGLYRKAQQGQLQQLTGFSAPFEAPLSPALQLNSEHLSVEECLTGLEQLLEQLL